jgi:hypothetical protein
MEVTDAENWKDVEKRRKRAVSFGRKERMLECGEGRFLGLEVHIVRDNSAPL